MALLEVPKLRGLTASKEDKEAKGRQQVYTPTIFKVKAVLKLENQNRGDIYIYIPSK